MRRISQIILAVLLFITIFIAYHYYSLYSAKRQILELSTISNSANPSSLPMMHELGSHFIVGYDDFEEVTELVRLGIIGGIFITNKNVEGKTTDQIRADISLLQEIQKNHGLPPLFIATDQEGGVVERLSPPLTSLPPLASLIDQSNCTSTPDSCFTETERTNVRQYAKTQGSELKDLGVNLNFAPVVDVYQDTLVNNDKYTHLESRALGSYPWLVAEIGTIYAQEMNALGVIPTLKHFPGLGSSTSDSHFSPSHLTGSLETFANLDFLPFTHITATTSAAIMLSHATLDAIDGATPASYSAPVIKYLRDTLGFKELLITDDFSMYPIQFGPDGVGGASVRALSAGVDLILISYNPDLYYQAMLALLKAQDDAVE